LNLILFIWTYDLFLVSAIACTFLYPSAYKSVFVEE